MSTTSSRGVGNGGVLAIAGAAAGAVGGIVVAVMEATRRRDEPTSRLGRWVHEIGADEVAGRARESALSARSRAETALRARVPKAVDQSKRLGQRSIEDSQRARGALTERLGRTGATISRELGKGSDVANQAASMLESVTKRSKKGARQLRSRSETYAGLGLERAREASERVAEASQDLVPEIQKRVEKQVIPLAQDLAETTAERAHDLYDIARVRAAEARKVAERDVAPALTDLSAQARDVLEDASHRLTEEAEALGERVAETSQAAAERATVLGRRAQQGTKEVAEAAAEEGKNLGSLLLWLALGGALVYYVFLDERQREQVQRAAQWLFSEGREVYRDIQGQDDQFA